MLPNFRERAEALWDSIDLQREHDLDIVAAIEAAIQSAVKDENEANAQIAESNDGLDPTSCCAGEGYSIATAIRQRLAAPTQTEGLEQ